VTRAMFLVGLTALAWGGCGVVGAPMPPEDVGVAPIIERQKRAEAAAAGRSGEIPLQPGADLPVPPIESVGTGVGENVR